MKSTHKVERFDYSKYESNSYYGSDYLKEYEFWGLHPKSGRIHIDTKRYAKACEMIGIEDFMPKGMFANRSTPYFIPAKQHKYDYIINVFNDLLDDFQRDWESEYKPIFKMIKTPKEEYENTRLSQLAYTSDIDDLEDIEFNSLMSSIKREKKYRHVVQSLYCQFIQKLAIETDRIMLIAMCKLGYKGTDYNFNSFVKFSDGLARNRKGKKINQLDKYNAYNMLHKINNFLKHNTISSYLDLKKYYPDNVASKENGTANIEYENGMFAGDWIIIKDGYIDDLLKKLRKFFKSYCEEIVKENVEDAKWNYDDYFINAFNEMKYPANYFGV
ncbi:MAG TPA: hypothetical protein IAC38_03380 [Candidatus Caccovivens faecavium]|nr:hypothetical protein [Candidatus Caccovivens faecavium]